MTAPEMIYVLQVAYKGEDFISRPVLYGSLKSAKKHAQVAWSAQPDAGKLSWTEVDEGDSFNASPAEGITFVISAELVHP